LRTICWLTGRHLAPSNSGPVRILRYPVRLSHSCGGGTWKWAAYLSPLFCN